MDESLAVYRDDYERYTRVGTLLLADGVPTEFRYDRTFLQSSSAQAISLSMPARAAAYGPDVVAPWFEALMPEGRVGRIINEMRRRDPDHEVSIVSLLRDETIGSLVFSDDGPPTVGGERYLPVPENFFDEFASNPARTAASVMTRTRLSLSGEMSKVGLCRDEATGEWLLPMGGAPSTHILKAETGEYPEQTVNEAFCARVAELCGIRTVETCLIPTDGHPPILAVRRFDREVDVTNPRKIDGHPRPLRTHQEDLCQALGLKGSFKYEPTGGNYANHVALALTRVSLAGYNERLAFLEQLLFSFLIGNCDNHLKNYSISYSRESGLGFLAPLYDVTCTTAYAGIDREMGVSLCRSRVIDDVTVEDIRDTARSCGFPKPKDVDGLLDDLCQGLPDAMLQAKREFVSIGVTSEVGICDVIMQQAGERIEGLLRNGRVSAARAVTPERLDVAMAEATAAAPVVNENYGLGSQGFGTGRGQR